MNYRDQERLEKTLRNIVLSTPDEIPKQVVEYLQEVSKHPHSDAVRKSFGKFRPLVDCIPNEYTRFLEDVLIEKPKKAKNLSFMEDYEGLTLFDKLGILDSQAFMPESYLNPPFLYLLRKETQLGISLIHKMAKTATEHWVKKVGTSRYAEQIGEQAKTPISFSIDWPWGSQAYIGDEQVYQWFRPNTNGPRPLKSAFMALEYWLKEEIERGGNPLDLFMQILSGSECVTLLGITLGMAFAYGQKDSRFLEAALPMLLTPQVWRLDIGRLIHDMQKPFYFDPLGRDKHTVKAQQETDSWPQRHFDIRTFALQYVLSPNESLRTRFTEGLKTFSNRLPYLFREEENEQSWNEKLTDFVQRWQSTSDPENIRVVKHEDGLLIYAELPENIRDRDAPGELKQARVNKVFSLFIWSQKTLETNTIDTRLTVVQAIEYVEEFYKDLVDDKIEGDFLRWQVPEAIVAAVAAMTVVDPDTITRLNKDKLCRQILFEVAFLPIGQRNSIDAGQIHEMDVRVSAAKGLTACLRRNPNDAELKTAILCLVANHRYLVVGTTLEGISHHWNADPVFCRLAWDLALSICITPSISRTEQLTQESSKQTKEDQLLKRALSCLENGDAFGEIERITDQSFNWSLAPKVLGPLSTAEFFAKETHFKFVIPIIKDILAWTINRATKKSRHNEFSNHFPFEWAQFFFSWLARVTSYLPAKEVHDQLLNPVLMAIDKAPKVIDELLFGFMSQRLTAEKLTVRDIEDWKFICQELLKYVRNQSSSGNRFRGGHTDKAFSHIVYNSFGRCFFTKQWPHAAVFRDIAEEYVTTIGHIPELFDSLLDLLNEAGQCFMPEPGLTWIDHVFKQSKSPVALCKTDRIGQKLATLLFDFTNGQQNHANLDGQSKERLSTIVDHLVAAKIPLASLIQ